MWWWIACGAPTGQHSVVTHSDSGTAATDSVLATDTGGVIEPR